MHQLRSRLTYANITATIALFMALGGGAYAATQLPKNSVGSQQLKKDSVTGAKVRDGSLTGSDIDTASLGLVLDATHATNADSADHATLATIAGSADHATQADHAGSADHATSAGESINSTKLGGHSPNEFITPLLGNIRNVAEATADKTEWGSISGISDASPQAEEVKTITPYYSTLYASGFTVYAPHPIGGGGEVDIRFIVNGGETGLSCSLGQQPFQGVCINPPESYVKIPGGSTLTVRILEEPNDFPSPEVIPAFSFQASVQLSTTPP